MRQYVARPRLESANHRRWAENVLGGWPDIARDSDFFRIGFSDGARTFEFV